MSTLVGTRGDLHLDCLYRPHDDDDDDDDEDPLDDGQEHLYKDKDQKA